MQRCAGTLASVSSAVYSGPANYEGVHMEGGTVLDTGSRLCTCTDIRGHYRLGEACFYNQVFIK